MLPFRSTTSILLQERLAAPHRPGHGAYKLQLALLLQLREPVPFHGGREAALGTQRQAFERDGPRSLFDATLQLVIAFEPWLLRGDEAEDHHAILRHALQRLEP